MIVLQAGVVQEDLLLWGETAPSPKSPARRKATNSVPYQYPFSASAATLSQSLSQAVPGLPKLRPRAETVLAWLPTVRGQAVPSSPMLATCPEGPTELAPWQINVLELPPMVAVDVLCACLDRDTLAPGVAIGNTLAYWAQVARFAGALVAREQFVPVVRRAAKGWQAYWQPILAGVDAQRQQRLAQVMPAACRALNTVTDAAPQRPAIEVLSVVVEQLVDALVRMTTGDLMPGGEVKHDSLHDAWLHALGSEDGFLTGSAAELEQLAEQVAAWQRPIRVSTTAPFRLCFRLEEPAATNGNGNGSAAKNGNVHNSMGKNGHGRGSLSHDWQVSYLLQAQEDPSLLVPAAQVWHAADSKKSVLHRPGFEPQEYVLTALGQASAICPPIEGSLKTAAPAGYQTDAGGAHAFLTETAWSLEQAGFGVLLPAWWTRKGTKQKLTAQAHVKSPKMQGGSGMSLEEIIQFDWQVALGDTPLTLKELEALARLKAPLVKVRGQWVQVNAEEIQAALDFWKKKGTAQATVREIVQMALGGVSGPKGLQVSGVAAEGWIADFLGQLQGQAAFAELEPPKTFQGTLRPYQVRGYSWLAFLRRWGLGACLADDMGLGKTVQTLALVQRDWHEGNRRPTLLVCPMSVVGNWKKEAERFTPELPVLIHHGLQRSKGLAFAKQARQQALVLTSYSLLHRDLEIFQKMTWAGVVLDEAQNIKNPETKQSRAARSLAGDYRLALTGTPVENHVGELWSIMEFLNPGFLGNQAHFRRRFFLPIQAQRDPEAAEGLKRLTGPFVLRRLKTDKSIISDLPEKLEMKVFCNLTKEQATLYAAVVAEADKALDDAEGIQRKGLVLATLSKLKQVCNHPAQFLGDNSPLPARSGKLARLTEMLEEVLASGERALIFTQFTEMGTLIQRHLQDFFAQEVLFLHGGVPQKQRDRLVERFQKETAGPRLFLLSLKAGGTGLNLTAANHVFHFDRWWNPAVENQATDRAFRIGQTRNVQVHKFLCVGTLEEKIDEMIERKKEVAGRVVGAGENWLTELSNDQLRDLFALRQEALGE